MSESQSLKTEKQAYAPPITPELDESLWLAWKEKNRGKDRVRAARFRRIMMLLVIAASAAFVLWLATAA